MWQIILLVFTSLLFISKTSAAATVNHPGDMATDPCEAQRRCSFEEIIVRALDSDNNCVLFRNECLFLNDMCERRETNQPALRKVKRTQCQRNCIEHCMDLYAPVCAEYNGIEYTFPNGCEVSRLACERDISYRITKNGECGNPLSSV
ncbi:uncharacterized protein LOC142234695 [Haematobia irritans]|uniref:uncharacterized protein LOC142234695 n=1 Tax=Haematobia irritans TaxID=7368 RepID=UPI003F501711